MAFIHIARVAGQLADAVRDLRPDNVLQVLNADLLQVRLTVPLTVKFRDIPDRRVFAQRQVVFARQFEKGRQRSRVPMHIVVGIDVRGRTSDE